MASQGSFSEGTEAERRRAAKKAHAVILLGEGQTYPQVAAAVGIGQRTLANWVAGDSNFSRALSELRLEKTSELTSRMVGSMRQVVDLVYREVFDAERSADRIRAAALYAQLTLRLQHDADVDRRMRVVEEMLGLVKARRVADLATAEDGSAFRDADEADDEGEES